MQWQEWQACSLKSITLPDGQQWTETDQSLYRFPVWSKFSRTVPSELPALIASHFNNLKDQPQGPILPSLFLSLTLFDFLSHSSRISLFSFIFITLLPFSLVLFSLSHSLCLSRSLPLSLCSPFLSPLSSHSLTFSPSLPHARHAIVLEKITRINHSQK